MKLLVIVPVVGAIAHLLDYLNLCLLIKATRRGEQRWKMESSS